MAQITVFIHPATKIDTFDHGAEGHRVTGIRFDDLTLHIAGPATAPYEDVGTVESCNNLIAAAERLRAVVEARLADKVRVSLAIERISADFTAEVDEDEEYDGNPEGDPTLNGAFR